MPRLPPGPPKGGELVTPALAPRPNANQMRLPRPFRGPSQMRFTASASCGVRQFVAGAPRMPQMLLFASNLHARGSASTPSATPSCASHALTAEAFAAFIFACVNVAVPVISFCTQYGHTVASCRRVW